MPPKWDRSVEIVCNRLSVGASSTYRGVSQRSYGMLNGVRGIFYVEADETGAVNNSGCMIIC